MYSLTIKAANPLLWILYACVSRFVSHCTTFSRGGSPSPSGRWVSRAWCVRAPPTFCWLEVAACIFLATSEERTCSIIIDLSHRSLASPSFCVFKTSARACFDAAPAYLSLMSACAHDCTGCSSLCHFSARASFGICAFLVPAWRFGRFLIMMNEPPPSWALFGEYQYIQLQLLHWFVPHTSAGRTADMTLLFIALHTSITKCGWLVRAL